MILITLPSCELKQIRPSASLFANASLAGAFFTTYESVKSVLKKANTYNGSSPMVPQPVIHSVASATAELVSCFILTPAEVLKQNAQMIRQPSASSSSKSSTLQRTSVTMQALKQFKRPSQLWTGYTALAARNLPFTAMQFPLFEHLKEMAKDYRKRKATYTGSLLETGVITGLSAGSAGALAAWITTPVDVVKTRLMLKAAEAGSEGNATKKAEIAKGQGRPPNELASKKGVIRRGGFQVAREVLTENGIKGLFRGAALRSCWTFLGSGLYLGVYESGRVYLGQQHEGSEE